MDIDARELDLQDLLAKLKEILASERKCSEVCIDIMVNAESEAKKVAAFVSMSGCKADIDKKDDCYILHVRGMPCCT